jgi:hypothetical protein
MGRLPSGRSKRFTSVRSPILAIAPTRLKATAPNEALRLFRNILRRCNPRLSTAGERDFGSVQARAGYTAGASRV